MPPQNIASRFWSHVRFFGPINPFCADLGECWVWSAARDRKGYGKFASERWSTASHTAYEIQVGPVPEGRMVCHFCDYPPCVRGSHLFLGTAAQNTADMMGKGRHRRADTHGEANPRAVLTWEIVRQIRRAGHSVPPRAWAEEYGVQEQTIRAILSGRNWKEAA